MLKNYQRIRKNKEFLNLYKKGGFLKNQFFLLKFIKNDLKFSRFGFVVSLKVSKRAVDRNLLKRRMREIIRSLNDKIKPGFDLIFIINFKAKDLKFLLLKNNVVNSLKKIRLLK